MVLRGFRIFLKIRPGDLIIGVTHYSKTNQKAIFGVPYAEFLCFLHHRKYNYVIYIYMSLDVGNCLHTFEIIVV